MLVPSTIFLASSSIYKILVMLINFVSFAYNPFFRPYPIWIKDVPLPLFDQDEFLNCVHNSILFAYENSICSRERVPASGSLFNSELVESLSVFFVYWNRANVNNISRVRGAQMAINLSIRKGDWRGPWRMFASCSHHKFVVWNHPFVQ